MNKIELGWTYGKVLIMIIFNTLEQPEPVWIHTEGQHRLPKVAFYSISHSVLQQFLAVGLLVHSS